MNPSFAWTDEQVRTALHVAPHEVAPHEDCSLTYTGISTDSRTTREGNLFVALCGDNFDGHARSNDSAIPIDASGISKEIPFPWITGYKTTF